MEGRELVGAELAAGSFWERFNSLLGPVVMDSPF